MPVDKKALPLNVIFKEGHFDKTDYDKLMNNLSANFRYIRSRIPKLSQQDVVNDMRKKGTIITTHFLCMLEQGKKPNPDMFKMIALANYYKIAFKEIMFTKPADFENKYF